MKHIFLLLMIFAAIQSVSAQNSLQLNIKDGANNQTIYNATIHIEKLNKTLLSDTSGNALFNNIPEGKYTIVISHTGYTEQKQTVNVNSGKPIILNIVLVIEEDELDEVIVSSTRTSRSIQNVPTRIETIDAEEIDEKSNMRPANVSMILHESTGIQVQQTSATSANASIRIQGLDGRYTQILKDGYPNFGNFASGLSILEIPPLDLKQVEIIKGASSTLYGAGAIAGVVNFVSKTPGKKPSYNFILNQTNLGGTDIAAFLSGRKNKMGYTLLVSANLQKPYDVDKDEFTELPRSSYYTVSPKLFFYLNDKTTLTIGNSFSVQERTGGDINAVKTSPTPEHPYFEQNNSLRNTSTAELEMRLKNEGRFIVKQSVGIFDRKIVIPDYSFKGKQITAYTDISYQLKKQKHLVISGINFIYDNFTEDSTYSGAKRDIRNSTVGFFIQDTWDVSRKLSFENGIRLDAVRDYGTYFLPRVSALYKFNQFISSRISGGLGYKLPTIFTEQTETIQYKDVLQLSDVSPEKSYGGTADINIKKRLAPHFEASLNQMFFYTLIQNSLVLNDNNLGQHYFSNTSDDVISKGFETNVKFIYKNDYKLFIGYTYTDAEAGYLKPNQFLPLLPKHKLNMALIYETENNLKAGFEAYYTGHQFLSDGSTTPDFWELGCMVEKTFRKISVYINAENFTDVRQSRYKRVANGTHDNPVFDEIWTHTEGRSFNAGIKLRL